MRTRRTVLALLPVLLFAACDDDDEEAQPEPQAASSETPGSDEQANAEPTEPAGETAAHSDEACARVIVVAWQGALAAGDDITRSRDEARARAQRLRTRVTEGGEDFATVARADSDASSSGPRGGLLGTYTREDWPSIHEPIRDAVFALSVGDTSDVLTAPYGFVIARRCPVESIHTRHILIRYRGAKNAPPDVTRTREQARARAEELRQQAAQPGADFAALARDNSEDASAEYGGDVGTVGRGMLAPQYEEAAYGLPVGGISPVVETDYGYHVIQRLPDED